MYKDSGSPCTGAEAISQERHSLSLSLSLSLDRNRRLPPPIELCLVDVAQVALERHPRTLSTLSENGPGTPLSEAAVD